MIVRNSLLGADVAEHVQLLLVFSAHALFLSVRSVETREFFGSVSVFPQPASEYGPHWEGFGKRYGMRLTGVATGNLMEVTLGAIWGEDPRYFPSTTRAFGPRMKHVVLTTFLAPHRDGHYYPAYARYAGIVGNNFLSNTWRADSASTTDRALARCGWGILSRVASQAFQEFWPDVRKKIFHK